MTLKSIRRIFIAIAGTTVLLIGKGIVLENCNRIALKSRSVCFAILISRALTEAANSLICLLRFVGSLFIIQRLLSHKSSLIFQLSRGKDKQVKIDDVSCFLI